MLLSFIASLFFAATAVFANKDINSEACSEDLEGVVYVPNSCALNYLKSINKVLKVQSPLFWSNPTQAQSAVQSFQATYGVFVTFIDAMGTVFSYPGSTTPIADSPSAQFMAYARANALGEGFSGSDNPPSPFPSASLVSYVSTYWNPDGQMYNVLITARKSTAASFC